MAYTTNPYNGLNLFANDTQDQNGQFGLRDYAGMAGLNNFLPLLGQQSAQVYATEPTRQGIRNQATALTTPQGRATQATFFGNQQAGSARARGREIGAQLRANGGGPEAERAAIANEQNRASDATTNFGAQNESPEAIIKSLQLAYGLNSPDEVLSILPLLLKLGAMGQSEASLKEQQRASDQSSGLGSTLGSLAGIVGAFL